MARPSGPKTRNSGKWTEAKFNEFIRNTLRSATRKWGPIQEVDKAASAGRGFKWCAGCGKKVPVTIKDGRKRIKNYAKDHIEPVVDPAVGFVDWNTYIERMFCEIDNLQVLCKACHDEKSAKEKAIAAKRRGKTDDID